MAVDFAIICSLVRPGRPRYPVLVHRAATLLHASSGRRLAMTPLRFANPSPPSGWIEDFHLQAVDHARHTEKSPGVAGAQSAEERCSEHEGIICEALGRQLLGARHHIECINLSRQGGVRAWVSVTAHPAMKDTIKAAVLIAKSVLPI